MMTPRSGTFRTKIFTRYVSVLVLILGVAVFQALSGVEGAKRPKKTFLSHMMLINKVYTDPIMKMKLTEEKPCKIVCQRVEECFAYAYSAFARMCHVYKYTPGMRPRLMNSYTIHIVEKSEEDGFYKYGMSYAKLFLEVMNAFKAQEMCHGVMEGMLITIKNAKDNEFLSRMMDDRKVFAGHIGLTDAKEEGTWLYYDEESAKYTNWHFKGMWNRTDKNCAMLAADKSWKQLSCYDKLPFLCQIPFY